MASHSPRVARELDGRQVEHLELPGERAREAHPGLVALDAGQKTDLAEVDPEHWDVGPGVGPQRPEHGPVPAQGEAHVDIRNDRGVELEPGLGPQPVLGRLLGIEAQDRTGRAGRGQ